MGDWTSQCTGPAEDQKGVKLSRKATNFSLENWLHRNSPVPVNQKVAIDKMKATLTLRIYLDEVPLQKNPPR